MEHSDFIATDPREMYEQTALADTLAKELLQQAQTELAPSSRGTVMTVHLLEPHPEVHYYELLLSLSDNASIYGLVIDCLMKDSVTLTKIL